MQDLDPRLHQEILRQIKDGRKIEAIKQVREATGLGLAEAKEQVEDMASGKSSASSGDRASRSAHRAGAGLPLEVQRLLRQGSKVAAIKVLRESTGMGLKDANDEVEAFLNLNPEVSNPEEGGAGKTVAIIVAIALAVAGWYVSRMMTGGP